MLVLICLLLPSDSASQEVEGLQHTGKPEGCESCADMKMLFWILIAVIFHHPYGFLLMFPYAFPF